MNQLLTGGTMVRDGQIRENAWVEIEGSAIGAVGTGHRTGGLDLGGRLLTPGFIDIHVHGALGVAFSGTDPAAMTQAVRHHREHGTTTMLAGIASAPILDMMAATRSVNHLIDNGDVEGIFYEGPYLSEARKGAHDPKNLQAPSVTDLHRLIEVANGAARLLTIAPELPGALDLIPTMASAHGYVAVGHTDASYEQAVSAFDAGATVATHLFNGMRPIHHRDPGPVIAAVNDGRVTCELITDGFHLNDSMIRFLFSAVGARRVALITDAVEATGVGDGTYGHGSRAVVVREGKAMLADGSSIAGSTLTMDRAVRRTVKFGRVSLPEAVLAATATPARAIGMAHIVGDIAPGFRADLVILDDRLSVEGVMRNGSWITGAWIPPTLRRH